LVRIAEYLIADFSKIPEGTIVPAGRIKGGLRLPYCGQIVPRGYTMLG
jgi:hypothetical protein